MTYKIYKTDGSKLTEVIDSAVDTSATDLALIGKNVTGYGEYLNENFIKLLENFASTTEPANPIAGQVWFDTSESRLKVYDGNGFRIGSGPIVSGTAPLNPIQGDFWIDSAENQLYFYDGVDRVLAGPIYKASQGTSGFEVDTIVDTSGNLKIILKLWAAETLLGIFSKYSDFTPAAAIPGYSGSIKPGFNAGTISGFKFNARATSADALVDALGNLKTTDSFLISDGDNTTTGSLVIANATPLTLGVGNQNAILVDDANFQVRSNKDGQDFKITVKDGSNYYDALFVKTVDKFTGIFNPNPTAMLHVGTVANPGNVVIEGNLTVNGTTTTINSTAIAVDDINIILGDTASPTDTTASTGGITLRSNTAGTGGNKTLTWVYNSVAPLESSWTSNQHFNLSTSAKKYKIGGVDILGAESLTLTGAKTSNLTTVGTLNQLQVDNININNNTISSTSGGITLSPFGSNTVDVATSRITSVQNPVGNQDAATKYYVDSLIPGAWTEVPTLVSPTPYIANNIDRLLIDTTAGSVQVILPDTPNIGDTVRFIDSTGSFDTNELRISRFIRVNTTGGYSGTSSLTATPKTWLNIAPTTDGTGSGLTINVRTTVQGDTYVLGGPTPNTFITILTHGQEYKTSDLIYVSGYDLGADSIASVAISGTLNSTGFTTGDAILFDPPSDPSGTPAAGTVVASGGSIVDIIITNRGSGYNSIPNVYTTTGVLNSTVLTAVEDSRLTFSLGNLHLILGLDSDLVATHQDASFGLLWTGAGWKYIEEREIPAEITTNVIGNLTGNVLGNVTGNVVGNVSGNLTGEVITPTQTHITALGTLADLTVTNPITGSIKGNVKSSATNGTVLDTSSAIAVLTANVSGDVTGDVLGNITGSSSLFVESTNNEIVIRSAADGVRISTYDDTGAQDQYAIQVNPGTNPSARSSTLLFGDVIVANQTSSNINGSSFRLPTYDATQLAARTLSQLNYGELIYNSTDNEIQAFIDDGSGVTGIWVALN